MCAKCENGDGCGGFAAAGARINRFLRTVGVRMCTHVGLRSSPLHSSTDACACADMFREMPGVTNGAFGVQGPPKLSLSVVRVVARATPWTLLLRNLR